MNAGRETGAIMVIDDLRERLAAAIAERENLQAEKRAAELLAQGLKTLLRETEKERDTAREALREVMKWIDNWDPHFVHDEEWPETKALVDAALAHPSPASASAADDGQPSITTLRRGARVTFSHPTWGYPSERERVCKELALYATYTVERVEVGQSYTSIWLAGGKGPYNSVFFDVVPAVLASPPSNDGEWVKA